MTRDLFNLSKYTYITYLFIYTFCTLSTIFILFYLFIVYNGNGVGVWNQKRLYWIVLIFSVLQRIISMTLHRNASASHCVINQVQYRLISVCRKTMSPFVQMNRLFVKYMVFVLWYAVTIVSFWPLKKD